MGHHDLHHHGHDLAHEVGAVLHLGTVNLAVPRGAAVHQLVAQGVDALEDQRQQFGRVALGQQDGGFATWLRRSRRAGSSRTIQRRAARGWGR